MPPLDLTSNVKLLVGVVDLGLIIFVAENDNASEPVKD